MIKIIKIGDPEKRPLREVSCSNCNCEFSFEKSDIRTKWEHNKLNQHLNNTFVVCPNCENEILVAKK